MDEQTIKRLIREVIAEEGKKEGYRQGVWLKISMENGNSALKYRVDIRKVVRIARFKTSNDAERFVETVEGLVRDAAEELGGKISTPKKQG